MENPTRSLPKQFCVYFFSYGRYLECHYIVVAMVVVVALLCLGWYSQGPLLF